MCSHEPDLAPVTPPAKSQTDIPNGFDARSDGGFDDVSVLSVALGSVSLAAADEQKEADARQSRIQSFLTSEIEFAELHALGLVFGAVLGGAGGGDDGGWVEVVGV